MRTTLNIRDDVYRRIRIRAAENGETVTSVVETALLRLLDGGGHDDRGDDTPAFRIRALGATGEPTVDLSDNAAIQTFLDTEPVAAPRR